MSFLGDAAGAVATGGASLVVGGAKKLIGGIDDAFSAETAKPYNPTAKAFEYGSTQGGVWDPAQKRYRESYSQKEADYQRQQQALAAQQAARQQWMGNAYLAGAGTWDKNAQAALAQSAAARGGQQSAYDRLLGLADRGPGPSAAQAQLRAGQDAAMAQSIALARSGRGAGGSASAQRQAMFGNAALAQQTNQQAAILRAQEEASWRQQQGQLYNAAGGLASQQRGQDLSSVGQSGQMALGYGALSGQAEQRAQGYGQQGLAYEQLRQGVITNATQAQMDLEKLRAQQSMAAQGINVQTDAAQDARLLGLIGTGIGAAGMASSDRDAKQGIQPANVTLRPDEGREMELLSKNPYDQMLEKQPKGTAGAGAAKPMTGTQRAGSFIFDQSAQQMSTTPDLDLQYLMSVSDRREKSNVDRLSELGAQEAVEKAPGYSYEYKQPERHGAGRFYGPMAQDLERTPAGRSTVREAPDGTKMVDTSRLSLVNTAALNGQQKQIDELMRRLDALSGKGRAA